MMACESHWEVALRLLSSMLLGLPGGGVACRWKATVRVDAFVCSSAMQGCVKGGRKCGLS